MIKFPHNAFPFLWKMWATESGLS